MQVGVTKAREKIIIIGLFVFILLVIGATVAYFTYEEEETLAIKGNVIGVDLDLDVRMVEGNDTGMVPLKDSALTSAINGTGSTYGPCIDSIGNLSCQIYQIDVTNNGNNLEGVNGTVELYAEEGSVYTNLKWQELSNKTTVKQGSSPNGMDKTNLVSGLSLASGESKTYYIAVWIHETDSDQSDTDHGRFGGTITFTNGEEVEESFVTTYMRENATSDANIDFTQTSQATGTNGIYLKSGTENDIHPIYYYRGAVDNNLIFAGFCWKIVRSTETGGIKILYNGLPSGGHCTNTGTASQIGTSEFNENYNSPAYVGYMYGSTYQMDGGSVSSDTTYTYGSSISYSNGQYTLTGNTKTDTWSNVYNGGLDNYHYTCLTTSTTCTDGQVAYVTTTMEDTIIFMVLTGGVDIEQAMSDMLDNNNTPSTIKGDKNTSGTLDHWYYNNIETTTYKSYIEDTVWCYDRGIEEHPGAFNPNGGHTFFNEAASSVEEMMESLLMFPAANRLMLGATPKLTCDRSQDRFTKDTANGNGDLDYPVGLISLDEIVLAGGTGFDSNDSYYLYTGSYYWGGSPFFISYVNASVSVVDSVGLANGSYVSGGIGVRPSVSLKPGTMFNGGTGKTDDPYILS